MWHPLSTKVGTNFAGKWLSPIGIVRSRTLWIKDLWRFFFLENIVTALLSACDENQLAIPGTWLINFSKISIYGVLWDLERCIVFTPLNVNVLLVTQWHSEYHCKVLFLNTLYSIEAFFPFFFFFFLSPPLVYPSFSSLTSPLPCNFV
jgi:hypothetical protein